MKLTSVKLDRMIDMLSLNDLLWCPVLNFGRKKEGRFRFPVIFKSYSKAEKCYDELIALKGKTLEEVKTLSEPIYEKYKKYHIKYQKK
jgi:hypothetical protein